MLATFPTLPTLAMSNDQWAMLTSIAIIAIIAGTVRTMAIARGRERSRREIAAYIAEGSMTPEQGERLMAAGSPARDDRH